MNEFFRGIPYQGIIFSLISGLRSKLLNFLLQWKQLNGIAVNGIIRLVGSNLTRFSSPKLLFYIYENL